MSGENVGHNSVEILVFSQLQQVISQTYCDLSILFSFAKFEAYSIDASNVMGIVFSKV